MASVSRNVIVFSVVGAVIILVAAYGILRAAHVIDPYAGLTTHLDVEMDEATRAYFEQRYETDKASLAAAEKTGDVKLDQYLALADDAYAVGDLVTARQALESQLKGNPGHYAAQNFYGTVLEAMGDYAKARVAYKTAIDLGAKVEEFYRDYVTLLENHYPTEREEIRSTLELSITEKGPSAWSMVELGKWYKEEGDCTQAIEHYGEAVKLAPQNKDIQTDLQDLKKTCK
jgi:tetratricopeptide (TPR) repeat protein